MKNLPPVDPECFVPAPVKKHPSVVKSAETRIRTLFISKGFRKFPKKEYIRCKLIRGHKRILREIQAKENVPESLLQENSYSECKYHYWTCLVESFLKHREKFLEIMSVDAGPVNVMMKKRNISTENLKRSFNADFCRDYLAEEETRKSYSLFINFLFCDLDCKRLNKRFGFRCCTSVNHKHLCQYKWSLMKKFCERIVLEDIGIQPYELPLEYKPVPSITFTNDYVNRN